jgi:hypothetical protein
MTSNRPRWTALSVGFLNHPELSGGPYDRRSAWVWLIQNAAWKGHSYRTRGGMIELKRGQVLVARDHLARAWKWSPGKVRLFLTHMTSAGMLEMCQSNGHFANIATICNYEKYQSEPPKAGPAKQPVKSQSKASGMASEKPYSTKDTKVTKNTDSVPNGTGESPRDDISAAFDDMTEVEAEPVPDDQRRRFDRKVAADDGMLGDILPPINIAIPDPRDENHAKQLLWGPVKAWLIGQDGANPDNVSRQLGGLRKSATDLDIVRAARTAQLTGALHPLTNMRGVLKAKPGTRNGRATASAADIFGTPNPSEETPPWAN